MNHIYAGELVPCSSECMSCNNKTYEHGVIKFMLDRLEDHMTVLDIGAHVGLWSVAVAKANKTCKVHAFEASKFPLTALSKNTIGLNISVYNVAVWNSKTDLYVDPKSICPKVYSKQSRLNISPSMAIKLDDYMPVDTTVDIIKLDVEGAELKALQGMGEIIDRSEKMLIMCEVSGGHLKFCGDTQGELIQFLKDKGFEPLTCSWNRAVSCHKKNIWFGKNTK